MDKDELQILAHLIAEELNSLGTARWLKLKQAVTYSAMGRDRLKKLALEGEIVGFQDTEDHDKWVFDRHSLDDYRQNQAGELERKAAEILSRLK